MRSTSKASAAVTQSWGFLVSDARVSRICHSIELETHAFSRATPPLAGDGTSNDSEATGSPAASTTEEEQQVSQQGGVQSGVEDPAPPVPKRPHGRPRRGEKPRKHKEARRGRRRSSRIRTATASRTPARMIPERRRGSVEKETPTSAATAGDKEWEVDRIIDSHIEADTLRYFYLVKWKGYDDEHNTWEPKRNLGKCSAAIDAYEGAKKAGS